LSNECLIWSPIEESCLEKLMNRPFLIACAALIGLGIFVDWQLSGAVDHEQPVSALDAAEPTEIAKLTARIEALERRIAALENPGHLVRQANSKASESDLPPARLPQPRFQPAPDQNQDAPTQKTNKQTWKIRLLSHKVSESSN
jgi:hypothetical protein